ncbi:MAG: phosphonate ABC transporter, permease protein PhnE, partial [Acidimicrobiia bacterium]
VWSVPLAFAAARNLTTSRLVRGGARGIIVACRAIPDLVFAAVFVRALGIGVLPGVLAISLHSIGMIGKLLTDAIERIDEGPRHATEATGASRIQTVAAAVVPQVLPAFIGTFLYRLDINVRISVVLGYVGAGGIGFALKDAFGGLAYRTALGITVVIVALIALVEMAATSLRRSLLEGGTEGGDPGGRAHTQLRPPWTRPRRVRFAALGLTLAGVGLAAARLGLDPALVVRAVPDIASVAGRFWPPNFSAEIRGELISAMVETVAIGVAATVLALILSLPLGLLAARNVAPGRWVYRVTRYGLVGWRGVPELIVAVVFVAAIGLGPVAGTLALAVTSVGFLAKLIADTVEEVDPGPREAVLATGATRLQETATSLLPQALPAVVSNVLYVLDINIRTSTVLGLVGGGGIGFLLFNSLRVLHWDVTGAILLLIFVTVYGIERASAWIRRHLA